MNWLLAPFHYAFMQSGLLAVILVGTTCAVLGSFVVLRRMAFIGDAMSHTSLPGIVIADLRGYNLFCGALIASLLTALGIGWLSGRETIREDTAIGVVFTAMFALGVLIISATRTFRDFSSIFLGRLLGVSSTDLILIAIITAIVLLTLWLFYKELELTSVDPSYSAVIGLRADWMRNLLLVLLALAVVTGIQAVGVLLTSALLVTPAAAASLLTRKLFRMMVVSAVIAITSGVIGLYASFYANVAPGPAIVLTATAWFGVVFIGTHVWRLKARRPSVG
jgi:ABC-type Mn2+/Zn2+ transport system permease subunit